ncbi:hypothetical protein QBC32DRAFT_331782 [Pseudoneurospora amorphoporcata]|uniref:Uncharacterized protein n=1 Tax=Pseudoneurospora amorphoporcata TaxID=241081 RepID=A0AAN6P3R7_9PEZI|nr:hypothetical protein QBC32DRAFT_331782 [Pseudoneurospora amorphoporcata]
MSSCQSNSAQALHHSIGPVDSPIPRVEVFLVLRFNTTLPVHFNFQLLSATASVSQSMNSIVFAAAFSGTISWLVEGDRPSSSGRYHSHPSFRHRVAFVLFHLGSIPDALVIAVLLFLRAVQSPRR